MNNKFTENFLELCESNGLNQTKLAEAIGVNQSQISRYLQGIIPNTETIVKICDFFGCSIDYIIGLNGELRYKHLSKGYNRNAFYKNYSKLLEQNNSTHYQLAKKKVVCETSLRLWKIGTLPKFEVICNIAYELGGSVDELLGRIN